MAITTKTTDSKIPKIVHLRERTAIVRHRCIAPCKRFAKTCKPLCTMCGRLAWYLCWMSCWLGCFPCKPCLGRTHDELHYMATYTPSDDDVSTDSESERRLRGRRDRDWVPLIRDTRARRPITQVTENIEEKKFRKPASKSCFFMLPRELRDKVYEYLFPRGRVQRGKYEMGDGSECIGLFQPKTETKRLADVVGLIRTCKQIYSETIHRIYVQNWFVTEKVDDLLAFTRRIGPAQLNAIRFIDLNIDNYTFPRDRDRQYRSVVALDSAFATLKSMQALQNLYLRMQHADIPIATEDVKKARSATGRHHLPTLARQIMAQHLSEMTHLQCFRIFYRTKSKGRIDRPRNTAWPIGGRVPDVQAKTIRDEDGFVHWPGWWIAAAWREDEGVMCTFEIRRISDGKLILSADETLGFNRVTS